MRHRCIDTPVAVAFNSDGNLLVVDRRDERRLDGAVIRVDPATGTRTVVSDNDAPNQDDPTDFINPSGIAIAPNNDILVTKDPFEIESEHTGVTRVNPLSGARQAFSDNLAPIAGTDGNGAWGIAIDSTPHIASSFVAPNVPLAGPARLRLTVTGLRYAVGGRDWSLSETRSPAGLAVRAGRRTSRSPARTRRRGATVPSDDQRDRCPPGRRRSTSRLARAPRGVVQRRGRRRREPGGPASTSPGPETSRRAKASIRPARCDVGRDVPRAAVRSIESPANGQTFVDQGSPLTASFACVAPAGVRSCTGSSANGASLEHVGPRGRTRTRPRSSTRSGRRPRRP